MIKVEWSAGVLAFSLAAAAPSFAQPAPGQTTRATVDSRTLHRQKLIDRLIVKWRNHLQEVYQLDAAQWVTQMAAPFDTDALEVLERAVEAKTFTAMTNAFLRGEADTTAYLNRTLESSDGNVAERLGDLAADLVFVPVTPCRVFDTRVAGGAIGAASIRNFDITGTVNYSPQGGDPSDCNGTGSAGSFAAAVINFTVVSPSGPGYITAFPLGGTQPLAATVNYVAGDIRGNLGIIKLDQSAATNELSVYTQAPTHLVGDIVGYLITPEATELTCVDTAFTTVNLAGGTNGNSVAPACGTGYTQTATNCESSSFQMPVVFSSSGTCAAQNNGVGSAALRASRTCCRVPGR